MNQFLQKEVPVRLETHDYEELRERVLRRDGWRCQLCGSMTNLEVHHQQFRSHSGEDTEDNLITLCTNCHSSCHRWRALPSEKKG
jgi:5-methylcytosine-specific restriction endonuclease McrA